MEKIFAKFSELQKTLNEFLANSKELYLLIQKAVNFLEQLFNWVPLSFILVLLFTFLLFRVFYAIYSQSKLLNFLLASLAVGIIWVFLNRHFLADSQWLLILRTYAILWGGVLLVYLLQWLLYSSVKFLHKLLFKPKLPTGDANFLWRLDEKVFMLKQEFKDADRERFQQAVLDLEEFLKKNR